MRKEITLETLLGKPDAVMSMLERRGLWTAPSSIYNTGYCAIQGHFTILRGSYGATAINIYDMVKMGQEFIEYAEILQWRKDAKIIGA